MTPIALTIAGSDSGGGAGIQADLKAFSALGVYGASAITAITAQNTQGVTAVQDINLDILGAQITAVLDDLAVNAIKIGMLSSPEIIGVVAKKLNEFKHPIVLDPVMVAKSGDTLLQDSAIDALKSKLLPMATVLTPNLPEAAKLLNATEAATKDETLAQGHALLAMGAQAVFMKGGHASGAICTDYLVTQDGITEFSAPRVDTKNTHGTGCTLSSAIAAELAKGQNLSNAVRNAHQYLQRAILRADELQIGSGHGPVHHFHNVWTS
ncbi:bifunctional hydroxymethylpyrimidine kinase/phosphomethylpyrimidine kinase [Amylibacter kogurei]|uniref:hydroxymethylpyrimidine kinase n=1 Tax=Paramylibacter kogurei TaxID=1889778 RepID=A0A2G5KAG0_9RHOB|nr:bifunctional hydroxymethylpyrimidine kinase/phosphomethylpyrimidine kinase [Amylibacter kogurei]PIB26159.1 bifunctional hydroxymethylpyrimidine kinase/phosphomethylpyrimidine kinase [Amylibacter kogurei]